MFAKYELQYIFDLMIDKGFYGHPRRLFMCVALRYARRQRIINVIQYVLATYAIRKYLKPTYTGSLITALSALNLSLPADAAAMVVYRDWANRPTLKHQDRAND